MFHSYDLKKFVADYGLEGHETYRSSQQLIPGTWIAGGAVRDMLQGIPIRSDIDYFTMNERVMSQTRKNHKAKQINPTLHGVTDDLGFKRQFISLRYYDTVEDLLQTFDFTIAQFAVSQHTLTVGDTSMYDLGRQRLRVNTVTYPVATMRRAFKYMGYGFTACRGTLNELIKQCGKAEGKNDVMYVD